MRSKQVLAAEALAGPLALADLLLSGFRPRPVTSAFSPVSDPIMSAIARHRAALEAFDRACALTDDIAALKTGRRITPDDYESFQATETLAPASFADLLETAPTSLNGLRGRYRCGA